MSFFNHMLLGQKPVWPRKVIRFLGQSNESQRDRLEKKVSDEENGEISQKLKRFQSPGSATYTKTTAMFSRKPKTENLSFMNIHTDKIPSNVTTSGHRKKKQTILADNNGVGAWGLDNEGRFDSSPYGKTHTAPQNFNSCRDSRLTTTMQMSASPLFLNLPVSGPLQATYRRVSSKFLCAQ